MILARITSSCRGGGCSAVGGAWGFRPFRRYFRSGVHALCPQPLVLHSEFGQLRKFRNRNRARRSSGSAGPSGGKSDRTGNVRCLPQPFGCRIKRCKERERRDTAQRSDYITKVQHSQELWLAPPIFVLATFCVPQRAPFGGPNRRARLSCVAGPSAGNAFATGAVPFAC